MTFALLLPQCDAHKVNAVELPIDIVTFVPNGSKADYFWRDKPVSALEVAGFAIGVASFSDEGRAGSKLAISQLQSLPNKSALQHYDLSKSDLAEAERLMLRGLIARLVQDAETRAKRNVELTRALATVRRAHEETQLSFSQLERFVYENNLAKRIVSRNLPPNLKLDAVVLQNGEEIVQRLPVGSVGLSDVVLYRAEGQPLAKGVLRIRLSTLEDDRTRAEWEVAASQMFEAGLRLSLTTALDADALTPILIISWHGEGSLPLSAALMQADSRYQVVRSGECEPITLAMTLWTYIPGAAAPVPIESFLPYETAGGRPRERIIDSNALSKAINLTPTAEYSRYMPERQALVVHPFVGGTSAMRIDGVLPPGTSSILAEIHSGSENSPIMDYALGVWPTNSSTPLDCRNGVEAVDADLPLKSPWVTLNARETANVLLALPEPLNATHDLVLFSRLNAASDKADFGWAIFENIKITLDDPA